MHVMMVLGTVRDMTEAEHQALINVCHARGIPVVGCNLGRAPEFTSKIIHALNCHALNGRLGAAVSALPAVGKRSELTKLAPVHKRPRSGKHSMPHRANAKTVSAVDTTRSEQTGKRGGGEGDDGGAPTQAYSASSKLTGIT